MHDMPEHRRGATFGALIGAFDTGIGTGSIAIGWMSERYGFSRAFAVAALLAALSIPYFLFHGEASDGLRPPRLIGPEGLAALPRHHDLRHAGVAAVGAGRGGQPAVLSSAPSSTASTSSTPPTCTRAASARRSSAAR